jgi:hypothetical protein
VRKLAIVGSHPRTKDHAPFEDAGIDVWVFNEIVSLGKVPRADAVFQMHEKPIWANPLNRNDPNHYAWLQQPHDIPVYMLKDYPEVPAAVAYPFEEICQKLLGGKFDRRYFTSSIAYAVALGIYLGYEWIGLYGVEMETNTEYFAQRDGVYFWVGVAVGRGIQIDIHADSSLFKAPLYGYEGDIELHRKDFEERLTFLNPLVAKARADVEATKEAQMQAVYSAAAADEQGKPAAMKALNASIRAQTQAVVDFGALSGAIDTNNAYIAKADAMTGVSGGSLFSRQEFEQTAGKAQDLQNQYEKLMGNIGGQSTVALKELEKSAGAGRGRRERLARDYVDLHNKYLDAAYNYGFNLGRVNENIELMQKVDALVRAAGGRKSEAVLLEARKELANA